MGYSAIMACWVFLNGCIALQICCAIDGSFTFFTAETLALSILGQSAQPGQAAMNRPSCRKMASLGRDLKANLQATHMAIWMRMQHLHRWK
jgi:hypothetical protein